MITTPHVFGAPSGNLCLTLQVQISIILNQAEETSGSLECPLSISDASLFPDLFSFFVLPGRACKIV